MTTFWRWYNAGGNWALFVVAFCLLEAPGVFWGQHTLTRTFREWFTADRGWLLVLGYQALGLYLFYHFFGVTK